MIPSRFSLYDIGVVGQQIESCLIQSEGELTPDTEAILDRLLTEAPEKLEAAAMVLQQLNANVEIIKAEEKRLADRRKAEEANAERLKARMVYALDAAFGGKLKTAKFSLTVSQTAPSVSFDIDERYSLEELAIERPDFVRVRMELNKQAIKDAYKSMDELPSAIVAFESAPTRYLRGVK